MSYATDTLCRVKNCEKGGIDKCGKTTEDCEVNTGGTIDIADPSDVVVKGPTTTWYVIRP